MNDDNTSSLNCFKKFKSSLRQRLDNDGAGSLEFLKDENTAKANSDHFETPIHRIGVSGGTAAFYKLKYVAKSDNGKTTNHYIGKDLSRALDEVEFYEDILTIKSKSKENKENVVRSLLPELLEFTLEYIGILSAPEAVNGTADDLSNPKNRRHLLVLRNLYDGCEKLRLLDFKIGQSTACSGWKKKSMVGSATQKVLDSLTNSTVEGYRLEGFDGSPSSLCSRDEMIKKLDIISLEKKRKMMYQHMTGLEIFSYLIDVRDATVQQGINEYFSAEEVSELVLHEIVKCLVKLAIACSKVTIPQKWVGSSVAIGYDCNYVPLRQKEKDIRSKVIVNIFDWGRSELNTPDKNDNFSHGEKLERRTFWKSYINGIYHLSHVAASTYLNHFGNSTEWSTLHLTVRDYDILGSDEFLGNIIIPIKATPLNEYKLDHVRHGKLSFSIEWQPYPSSSRLHGSWKIFIQQAKNLIIGDLTSSDPYCVVTALSSDNKLCFDQTTKVISKSLNPVWEEKFELPIMKSDLELKTALEGGGMKYLKPLNAVLENKELCERLKQKKKLKEFYGGVSEFTLEKWGDAISHSDFCRLSASAYEVLF